jgi:hypothetical protein
VFEMKKNLFILPGYLIGIACLGLITYRTLSAVRTESKSITVQVNQYGEQYLDVALLAFFWIVCIIGVISLSSQGKEQKMKVSKEHDHHRPEREHHEFPLGFSPHSLSDDTPEVPPGILRAPTTEITERFSQLDNERERLAPSDEKNIVDDELT